MRGSNLRRQAQQKQEPEYTNFIPDNFAAAPASSTAGRSDRVSSLSTIQVNILGPSHLYAFEALRVIFLTTNKS